jgi:hypothetical protein
LARTLKLKLARCSNNFCQQLGKPARSEAAILLQTQQRRDFAGPLDQHRRQLGEVQTLVRFRQLVEI